MPYPWWRRAIERRLETLSAIALLIWVGTTAVAATVAANRITTAVASEREFEVGPAESRWIAVRLQLPYGTVAAGSHPIRFDIETVGGDAHVREKSVFLVPR